MRIAALALAFIFPGSYAAASPAPAVQELAGASREAPHTQAMQEPAMAERRTEPLPPITFDRGSAKLTPSATRLLDEFRQSVAEDRLRVESHAGTDRDLASRRAQAVVAYLEENCGIPAARVQVVTATRADDRRVWVQVLGE